MHMNSSDLEKLKKYLKEEMVKIKLKRIDTEKKVIVEALLKSSAISFIISLEFARKQRFKLKKTERLVYVRNVDGIFMSDIVHT